MKINETKKNNSAIYILFPLLFAAVVLLNDRMSILQSHPDVLLIFLVYLVFRSAPGIAVTAGFFLGFLQDVLLPGDIQYWGLSPLMKTLFVYVLLRLSIFVRHRRGILPYVFCGGLMFIYFLLYNMLYYSGYTGLGNILIKYTLPEFIYTFIIFILISIRLPFKDS